MSECVDWQGNRHDKGYGRLWNKELKRYERATHVVLRDEGSDVPSGMLVMHTCDNPPCVNPDHLVIGTHSQNMADMKAKGRGKSGGYKPLKGTRPPNTKLSETDVACILERIRSGESNASIGRSFGVTRQAISRIKTGKNWSEIRDGA